ncbi:MAG: hypothetical protein MZW92_31710 [Comamonadaceae bacterium]|nr:hypothetical protein [Comamonadaceae bacterium]
MRNWINGLPGNAGCGGGVCSASVASCNTNPLNGGYVHGDEALAMLTAAGIVDMVWTEVMGFPLTIDLYHPRNDAQRNILWNLTEYNFVDKHWSLREVLVRVLLFDYFNRRAPATGDGIRNQRRRDFAIRTAADVQPLGRRRSAQAADRAAGLDRRLRADT